MQLPDFISPTRIKPMPCAVNAHSVKWVLMAEIGEFLRTCLFKLFNLSFSFVIISANGMILLTQVDKLTKKDYYFTTN